MGTLLCWRTVIGEDGEPQGVLTAREAMGVKPSRRWRPVPPITAIWIGLSKVVGRDIAIGLRCERVIEERRG